MDCLKVDDMVLEAILSDDFYNTDIETIEVLISEIKHKTKISQIVNYLTKKIPLNSLKHLKRIKAQENSYEVIVCVNDSHNKQIIEEINEYLVSNDLLPLKTKSVALRAPLTRFQYELSTKLWPISFHENKYISKCLNSTLFDSNARTLIFNVISKAIQMSNECNDKSSVIAIVTDKSHNIITSAESDVERNPLKHAVMVAIDRVSAIQGGGHWITSIESQQSNAKLINDSYLCSGFNVYVTREPCIMCSMALIHSRIKRLFFLDSCETQITNQWCDRAITLHKLHLFPKLNHHYESWKITFKS